MKKILAFALAVVMVFALGVSAFAAPADLSGHTYTAYQIFKGTQAKGSAELGNVEWGKDVDGAKLLAALKADTAFNGAFADCEDAADVAAVMQGDNWGDKSANAKEFAKVAKNCVSGGQAVKQGDVLDAGYYLVKDTTSGDAAQYNLALLQLTNKGEFDIENKVDVPEIDKQVSDASQLNCKEDHEHTKDCYNWTDSNAAALGDTVNFKVTAKVPAAAADYDYYFYIINDTLCDGLDLVKGSYTVVDKDGNAVAYSVKDEATHSFKLALQDAKAYAGQEVYVYYDAVINNAAIIGAEGNLNAVDVKYSSKPDFDYKGENDGENPGFPKDETKVPMGETPDAKTLTFVSGVKLYKVDEKGNALSGAEFTITGNGVNTVLVSKEVFTANAEGEYYKLADGTYTKEAPVKEDSMKAVEGATAGYVVAENGYDKADKVEVNGIVYRPYAPATDKDATVYVLVKNNVDAYASVDTKYTKETKIEPQIKSSNVNVVGTVDENGVVVFKGLDEGTYTIEETKVPAGYNKMENITLVISADLPETVTTGDETCTWSATADGKEISLDTADATVFALTVVNHKGGVLPETGGIGTTIFYAIGGMMVVAAALLLITKKRMGNEA